MIELSFDISPDENGIIDGRDLARAMVLQAYRLLVPYVGACPACSDALFSAVANDAIEELHKEERLPGLIMNVGGDDPDGARWRQHYAEGEEFTRSILDGSNAPAHQH